MAFGYRPGGAGFNKGLISGLCCCGCALRRSRWDWCLAPRDSNSLRFSFDPRDAGSWEFATIGVRYSEPRSIDTTDSRCGRRAGRVAGSGSQAGMAQCVDESNIEAPLVLWPAFFRKFHPRYDARVPTSLDLELRAGLDGCLPSPVLMTSGIRPGRWPTCPISTRPDANTSSSLRNPHGTSTAFVRV